MCSGTQPKTFGGAMPLGSGGNFGMPTVYQSNPQATSNVGFTPAPATPATTTRGQLPTMSMNASANPASSPQPSVGNVLQYAQWLNQFWPGMGRLPTMSASGPNAQG